MEVFPANILNLLHSYGYYVLFFLVIVEGPFVTVLSGIMAAAGFFNFFIAYLVVMAGDLAGDVLYYMAGRWWFRSWVNKRFSKLEEKYKKHKGKILFFGKLSSFIGSAVMLVAGALDIPFPNFLFINLVSTLFKSLMLLLIGYYFGGIMVRLGKNLDIVTSLGLLVLTILIAGIYFLVSKISEKYFKKLQKD